ncbi:hypothetical protein PV08_03705 [Exophiala spinifera]|uniref:Sterigmatocystin biosynthesis monooxygenase stcW n=1 Tax=Exophiala spinifera TaxID=91928 RepID=A0A0D2BLG1_9EURO|nr:uncharacterized protein PV08_03705 [Exophiala spinifera]KIW19410.1 hypothetical protein PV08_03705 [Exophiala spinifera]
MAYIATSEGTSGQPKPDNWVPILEQPLSTRRKLRMICLGAGFSGLTLAYKIRYDMKYDDFIDFQIYEKNPDLGGTWYENRYPGAACSTIADSYVFPFEPNPNWSTFYAGSREIWQYMKDTAVKWDLEQFVTYNSKVTDSVWDDENGRWKVKIDRQGIVVEEQCDILVNASGFLNKWTWPNIEGLHDFKGKLIHTAAWDQLYDWTNKKVAVIGNGSSAIQLVPHLQKTAKQVVNYVRSPTWIAANFLEEYSEGGVQVYSEERKKQFREDPSSLFELRKKMEHGFNGLFRAMLMGTSEQKAMAKTYRDIMESRLGRKPELIDRFVPTFTVGCRRLTPGDGYLEALQEENVRCLWSPIAKVTETGILTEEGLEDFDLIVTATGFDVSFRPSWNLIGRNGASLKDTWAKNPTSYFSICAVDHPNYFVYAGPNSPVAHGVLPGALDQMSSYILKWCKKIAEEDIKSITVKPKVVDDLNVWSQELLSRTVWAGNCRSWYKNGTINGNITALHAGSAMHFREMLENIRGEDFEISYRSANEFRYLGNGLTLRDANGGDLAYYLKQ